MTGVFDIMHSVDQCLMGQIGQAITDAGWTNTWTTATMKKNNYWLTNEDPGLLNQINNLPNDAGKVAAWIQANCNLNQPWSTALVVALQGKIATYYNKDDWGAVLGSVGSFASMISAAMTQDTTTGDTEGKNMQSQLQTDNSAMQPISDFGSAYAQFLGALATVLGQVGPGA